MAYNWKTLSHFWIQMLDLNDIVVFARVVEAGSFTAAARLLGMPKTTVSRRIAALEREVGVRLVQRTTRSLNMTDAGRLYYEQSSQALRTIEDANLRLAETRAEPSGTIRISAPVGFCGHFLTSAVFDFLAAYPETRVAPHGRHTQSGREPDRPRFPHRDSSGLDTDRPQARLHASNPVRQPGLPRSPRRPGSVGGPRSPSLRHCGPIDRQRSMGDGRAAWAGNGSGVWALRRQ